WRNGADRRLGAHPHEFGKCHIVDRRGGCCRVLGIEGEDQDAVATLFAKASEPGIDGRESVAHRPVDHDPVVPLCQPCGKRMTLRAGDGLEWGFIEFAVPDLVIRLAATSRAGGQNDAVKDRPPKYPWRFDYPAIAEKLLQVAPHRPIAGRFRRAEIDDEHADPTVPDGRALALRTGIAGRVHDAPFDRGIEHDRGKCATAPPSVGSWPASLE